MLTYLCSSFSLTPVCARCPRALAMQRDTGAPSDLSADSAHHRWLAKSPIAVHCAVVHGNAVMAGHGNIAKRCSQCTHLRDGTHSGHLSTPSRFLAERYASHRPPSAAAKRRALHVRGLRPGCVSHTAAAQRPKCRGCRLMKYLMSTPESPIELHLLCPKSMA